MLSYETQNTFKIFIPLYFSLEYFSFLTYIFYITILAHVLAV